MYTHIYSLPQHKIKFIKMNKSSLNLIVIIYELNCSNFIEIICGGNPTFVFVIGRSLNRN